MTLTPYQVEKFKNLDDLKPYTWFRISISRIDYEEFITCLIKYNECWNLLDIEIEEGRFRKRLHQKSIEWCKKNNIEI